MARDKATQEDWLVIYLKYLLFVFNFFFWVSKAAHTAPPPSAPGVQPPGFCLFGFVGVTALRLASSKSKPTHGQSPPAFKQTCTLAPEGAAKPAAWGAGGLALSPGSRRGRTKRPAALPLWAR